MKKVIVTGGAGFIGSHLCDLLHEKDYIIGIIDNFSYGKKNFVPEDNKTQMFEADIRNEAEVKKIFEEFQPEIIYHLAALHHIPTCEQKPSEALEINILGTQNILSSASGWESLERIVFASSGAVYDIVENSLMEDSTPVKPFDIYSTTKLSGEYLMSLWAKKYGKKAYIGRIFNTIGGRETNDHLVPDIVSQILAGQKEIRLGNLEPKRSYIDVRDTAMALLKIGEFISTEKYDVFNIGREDEYNVKEIVEKLMLISKVDLKIVQDHSRIRKVDRKKQQASIKKIKDLMQWKPVYSVDDGLEYAYSFAHKRNEYLQKSNIVS